MTRRFRDWELYGNSEEIINRHGEVDTSKTQESLMKMNKEDIESWARPKQEKEIE